MNLDEILKDWEMFGQTLRKPDSDYFAEFIDGIKGYKKAIESKENKPTEAFFMALILQNQKIINDLLINKKNYGLDPVLSEEGVRSKHTTQTRASPGSAE